MVSLQFVLFGYFSPETFLPAASILATVLGVVLMVGRGSWRFLVLCSRRGFRRGERAARASQPHFRLQSEAHTQAPRS
jgi:hypothetical protein